VLRALATAIALLVGAACAAPPPTTVGPTPAPTHEPGTFAVTVLLDLSGSRGPRGDAQRSAMQQWADAQRGTPRLKLRIVDVGGSDAKLVIELKHLSDSGDADAVVVGVPAVVDDRLTGALALVARPVLFTLPIAEPSGDGARWMFGLAPSPDAIARALVNALPSRSSPAIVVVAGTLPSGREEIALTATFRADGRPTPLVLSAAPDQRDGFAQRLRPFVTSGAAIFFTGSTVTYLEPQRLLPDGSAPAAPLLLSYLTDAGDAARLGDVASSARWPALRKTIGSPLGTHAATATDALSIIAANADPAGDPERTRGRIEAGTFAGIATTYTFAATRRAGADARELALVAWENGRIVAARPIVVR
jgi:hypothetical protein